MFFVLSAPEASLSDSRVPASALTVCDGLQLNRDLGESLTNGTVSKVKAPLVRAEWQQELSPAALCTEPGLSFSFPSLHHLTGLSRQPSVPDTTRSKALQLAFIYAILWQYQ